jgi:hypothetical protein
LCAGLDSLPAHLHYARGSHIGLDSSDFKIIPAPDRTRKGPHPPVVRGEEAFNYLLPKGRILDGIDPVKVGFGLQGRTICLPLKPCSSICKAERKKRDEVHKGHPYHRKPPALLEMDSFMTKEHITLPHVHRLVSGSYVKSAAEHRMVACQVSPLTSERDNLQEPVYQVGDSVRFLLDDAKVGKLTPYLVQELLIAGSV